MRLTWKIWVFQDMVRIQLRFLPSLSTKLCSSTIAGNGLRRSGTNTLTTGKPRLLASRFGHVIAMNVWRSIRARNTFPSPNVKESMMHPNHTPKKFLSQPINYMRHPFLVPWSQDRTWCKGEFNRTSSFFLVHEQGTVSQAIKKIHPRYLAEDIRFPAWGKQRQNNKIATDSEGHSNHYYRSWRNLIDRNGALAEAPAIEEG
jgi:hypothetical protein